MATQSWRTSLLPAHATVQDAIRNLDESALQIVLVVAEDRTLVGTLTDGDIRRGLLRGLTLNSAIETIVHREPLVVPPQWDRDSVRQLMRANKIHQIPVVDDRRRVVGLFLWDELTMPQERPNPIVVMAGGRGTRLMPYTENCPKPLLPIGGKPMLQHIVERARAEGFEHFVFAVHYLGHMIEEHFGDGRPWQVSVRYLREQAPLGTAGALGLLQPRPQVPFIVTNGDVLTDIRYGELLDFHQRNEAVATMAVRQHEWQHPFGVVRVDGIDIVGFDEKPISRTHINAGIYVLEPEAVDMIEQDEPCDMPALFARLHRAGRKTIAYPMHEPWLDVGRPDDLQRARDSR